MADELKRINPDAHVECFDRDFCSFTDAEIDENWPTVNNLSLSETGWFEAPKSGWF